MREKGEGGGERGEIWGDDCFWLKGPGRWDGTALKTAIQEDQV